MERGEESREAPLIAKSARKDLGGCVCLSCWTSEDLPPCRSLQGLDDPSTVAPSSIQGLDDPLHGGPILHPVASEDAFRLLDEAGVTASASLHFVRLGV